MNSLNILMKMTFLKKTQFFITSGIEIELNMLGFVVHFSLNAKWAQNVVNSFSWEKYFSLN